MCQQQCHTDPDSIADCLDKIDKVNNCLDSYCKKDDIAKCCEGTIHQVIEQKMCLEISLLKNCLINMIDSKLRTLYIRPEDINQINNRIHNISKNVTQLDQNNKTFQTWATNQENQLNDLNTDYNHLKNQLLGALLNQ